MYPALAILLVFTIAALAQTPAKEPETPPETQALRAARKIEDPEQRIAALRDVIKMYPKHSVAGSARYDIFETTTVKFPNDRERVLKAAEDFLKEVSKGSRRYAQNDAAGLMVNAKTCLPDAERYVRASLASYKQDKFYSDERKSAKKEKRPEPTEAELRTRFNESRSGPLENLGLVLVAQSREEEGRPLLEEAWNADKGRGRAAAGLSALAEKNGDEKKALEMLYLSKLSGRMPKEAKDRLERLHQKVNGGDIDTALDKVYRANFPAPVHADAYRAENRTGRVVLAEVFTGAGCPPCAAADLSFDVVMERYQRTDVAVLMYHQHIPRPDPMTTPETEKRFKWYARGGVPTYVIDGKVDGGGGPRSGTDRVYKKINDAIEKRLALPPKASLSVEVTQPDSGTVEVKASAKNAGSEKTATKLFVVLAEKELRYTGENGIRFHPMVVRDYREFDVDLSKPDAQSHRFNLAEISARHKAHLDDYEVNGRHGKITFSEKKHEIEGKQLVVVAFVQDPESKDILQSIHVDLQAAAVSSNR